MRQGERVVPLAGGGELRTPLLVPAVSSAGFDEVTMDDGSTMPESAVWLSAVAPFIPKALLISAYDIHYGNLPDCDELRRDFRRSIYSSGRHLFIDSGLYEKVHGPPPQDGQRLDWELETYEALVGSLDFGSGAIIVNYDMYAPYADQIAAAQRFFAAHDRFSSDLLLKPEERGQMLDIDAMTGHMKSLRGFHLIGVTEKELGDSLLRKLEALSKLRQRLNEARVGAPIHVFGSLDPVLAPLYQAAGAEVFDGLSWLRFGYVWDASVYKNQVAVLGDDQDLTQTKVQRDLTRLVKNASALGKLNEAMRQFANTGDWTLFGERIAHRLQSAHRALTTTMGE
jgi:hypothetical protein